MADENTEDIENMENNNKDNNKNNDEANDEDNITSENSKDIENENTENKISDLNHKSNNEEDSIHFFRYILYGLIAFLIILIIWFIYAAFINRYSDLRLNSAMQSKNNEKLSDSEYVDFTDIVIKDNIITGMAQIKDKSNANLLRQHITQFNIKDDCSQLDNSCISI